MLCGKSLLVIYFIYGSVYYIPFLLKYAEIVLALIKMSAI